MQEKLRIENRIEGLLFTQGNAGPYHPYPARLAVAALPAWQRARLLWFRQRVGTLQGRTRRIAIVALARKLLIALWRYVEAGVLPAGVEIRTGTVPAA